MRSGRGREVIVRVRDLRIEPGAPPRAAVTLAVGLAGSGRGPGRLGAEVYAVDLDLVREDDAWRVSWAQWRPAPATDLLQLSSPSTFVTDASPVRLEGRRRPVPAPAPRIG